MAFAGPLVGFSLGAAERAQRFLDACELVAEATSFGGVHSTAERRGRWGTDAVDEGFIRFSAGCEDAGGPQMDFAGPLVGFDLGTAERAQAFLAACSLVAEATSFGGVHSTAERRGRWGTDAVSEGFIRFSAGCEDTATCSATSSALWTRRRNGAG